MSGSHTEYSCPFAKSVATVKITAKNSPLSDGTVTVEVECRKSSTLFKKK